MKKTIKLFALSLLAVAGMSSISSCSEDELGESIFEIRQNNIDMNSYTAPLDSFCKKCFLEPYNLEFKYKMEDVSTDVQKNLVPATYQKSKEMAVLTKYLWLDVYREKIPNGEFFLKKYAPRIIHLVGSKSLNVSTGTETLGEAAGGIKIQFYKTNTLDVNNLAYSNEYFFHTMHHEFGHQLCSQYVVPTDYRIITAGTYDALSWQETSDSVALGQGYITQYSRNNYEDDFVELFAQYVTSTDEEWQDRLNTSKFSWEEVDVNYDYWDRLRSYAGEEGLDSIGYLKSISERNDGKCTVIRKIIRRESVEDDDQYAHAVTDSEGNIIYEGEGGYKKILEKFRILKEYMMTNYKIDIDAIRNEINRRCYYMDEQGNFILGPGGKPMNRIKDDLKGLLNNLETFNF